MLSIRLPLAIIITAILAIGAFFAHSSFSSTSFGPYLASIFVILTFVLMALPSMFANMANGSEPQTSQKRVKTKPNVTTAEGMATLYVGNLPYKANEESIKSLFAAVGHVESVRLMKDRKTGRRKGFGFVEVEASKLDMFIDRLNDHEFMDRTIKVRTAKDKAS